MFLINFNFIILIHEKYNLNSKIYYILIVYSRNYYIARCIQC